MEPGINDKVKMRSIVLHGSRFVGESILGTRGIIGRSLGCPAVPYGLHFRIIDEIKGGSCVFVSFPDDVYVHTSQILNAGFDLVKTPSDVSDVSLPDDAPPAADNGSIPSASLK